MAKAKKTPEEVKIYRCMCCGMETDKPMGKFYRTPSPMYADNDHYYPVCISCLKAKFEEFRSRYDEKTATRIICHYLDAPFYYSLYDSTAQKNDSFSIGAYMRQMNNRQYVGKTFVATLLDRKELLVDEAQFEDIKEEKWKPAEHRNKKNVIEIIGYDPFDGYNENQRRFLFNNIIGYLEEDGIEDDQFKISQIIQLVNNNYQILQLDMAISKLDPQINATDIKVMNELKKRLVDSNDKIAKENGISVKNRLNQQAGRSTLTYLMKYLRELDIPEAEANYYDQLKSPGTQWAANMSFKAIRENGFFDENDFKDIIENQYKMIQELQGKLDDVEEENRLLLIKNDELKAGGKRGK